MVDMTKKFKMRAINWRNQRWSSVGAMVLWLAVNCVVAEQPEWPQWRGVDGQGHATAKNLPSQWNETDNIAWKTALPGKGWSSPVIAGNQIWMTTAVVTLASDEEKEARLVGNTGSQPLEVVNDLSMRAICVDRQSGKLLSNIELMTASKPDPVHALNSFASPSPVIQDGMLYCHFGTNGTACLDTDSGEVVWTNQSLPVKHENGPGSSLVLWKDVVIFHSDGSDTQEVIALDKLSGKVAWRTPRSGTMHANPQMKKAYATPLIHTFAGREQLISPGADWLYSYDPATGKELWKLSYGVLGFSIVPRPVADGDTIYMCTSFMKSELLAIRPSSEDVNATPTIAWRYGRQVSSMPSPLLVDNRLYFVADRTGIVTCLNAKTGESIWQERIGGSYSSSPLYADGKIYFCSRDGTSVTLAPGDKFEQLGSGTLEGSIMASPAAVENSLYIRTDKALYRIEQP